MFILIISLSGFSTQCRGLWNTMIGWGDMCGNCTTHASVRLRSYGGRLQAKLERTSARVCQVSWAGPRIGSCGPLMMSHNHELLKDRTEYHWILRVWLSILHCQGMPCPYCKLQACTWDSSHSRNFELWPIDYIYLFGSHYCTVCLISAFVWHAFGMS